MNAILICAILSILVEQPPFDRTTEPPLPAVLKVDPPGWWPGHTLNPVRLLVRGRNLQGAKVGSSRHDVVPSEVRINERGTYLFVSLAVDPKAPAGDAPLEIETRAGTATVPFRLEPPLDSKTFAGGQGITQDDVIYLIMPDRFSDGDVANNAPADSPGEANGRNIPRGWHGGDLAGSSIIWTISRNWASRRYGSHPGMITSMECMNVINLGALIRTTTATTRWTIMLLRTTSAAWRPCESL